MFETSCLLGSSFALIHLHCWICELHFTCNSNPWKGMSALEHKGCTLGLETSMNNWCSTIVFLGRVSSDMGGACLVQRLLRYLGVESVGVASQPLLNLVCPQSNARLVTDGPSHRRACLTGYTDSEKATGPLKGLFEPFRSF